MLEKVREPWRAGRFKGIVAYVIFGTIALTFVFVGFNPNQNFGGAGAVASVNDSVISMAELQESIKDLESRMGPMTGMPAEQRKQQEQRLRVDALNQLITFEVLVQSAKKEGVMPTQAAVRDLIVSYPAFQEEGKFTRDYYDRFLAYKNMTATEFESRIKKNILVNQIRDLFLTALDTPKLVSAYESRLRETKINVEFIKIDNDALTKWLKPSSQELDSYIVSNSDKIKNYYDANKEEFSSEPEVKAQHILIKGTGSDVLKKIQDIKSQLTNANFEVMAKKYSEDTGTKDKGGQLDFFKKGQMVKAFEDAAFGLPIGQVSSPVQSDFGYHLIKVNERRGGVEKKLEDVQKDIATHLIINDIKEKKLAEIEDDLKQNKNVSRWISELGVRWQESGEFQLGAGFVPKLGGGESILNAILSLRDPQQIYPGLIADGSSRVILKLKELKNPPAKSWDEVGSSGFSFGGAEALNIWAEELKKKSRIETANIL